MTEHIAYIKKHTGPDEVLAQLAEEADELGIAALDLCRAELLVELSRKVDKLGHAALKLRRALSTTNPTPITPEEAYRNLIEELGDVSLCLNILGVNNSKDLLAVQRVMTEKAERWAERIREVQHEKQAQ